MYPHCLFDLHIQWGMLLTCIKSWDSEIHYMCNFICKYHPIEKIINFIHNTLRILLPPRRREDYTAEQPKSLNFDILSFVLKLFFWPSSSKMQMWAILSIPWTPILPLLPHVPSQLSTASPAIGSHEVGMYKNIFCHLIT